MHDVGVGSSVLVAAHSKGLSEEEETMQEEDEEEEEEEEEDVDEACLTVMNVPAMTSGP